MLDEQTDGMVSELLKDWECDDRDEMLRCAQVTLEQLWKFAPQLVGHPFYALTVVQLRSAIEE
ncbi:MAG: hypothetical protein ACR2RF_24895 [Geminicoccaceae bacterium]